ncbi:hypothetical protein V3481_017314 [Fusarium oxysporum f. sp. vasinfectum]|uniref:Uncharacterized protein n=1 Tax=Fusarium oxysporum f. sp. vasinfectum 25433 TaxID=1089449 RepID=X0KI06_FUSOX|nr:hypothetical protein FOTG_18396 [Fusarium oxysporum f. sp. vasinfectum 25433]
MARLLVEIHAEWFKERESSHLEHWVERFLKKVRDFNTHEIANYLENLDPALGKEGDAFNKKETLEDAASYIVSRGLRCRRGPGQVESGYAVGGMLGPRGKEGINFSACNVAEAR